MRTLQAKIVHREKWEATHFAQVPCSRIRIFACSLTEFQVFFRNTQSLNQRIALVLVETEMLPCLFHVRHLEIVNRKLLFIREPNIPILHFASVVRIACPDDVIDRIHVLEKRADAFEAISQFGRNWK